jgi:hypothetical protein
MMTPGLVLDTAAIVEYSDGSERVGRHIAEVAEAALAVVVPALCLATAYHAAVGDRRRVLDVLPTLPHVVIRPVEADMCAVLGGWTLLTEGHMDHAQAAIEAVWHPPTPILTDRRDLITKVLADGWPIIDL